MAGSRVALFAAIRRDALLYTFISPTAAFGYVAAWMLIALVSLAVIRNQT